DHKFDPIPNRDYYALYGIFNSTRYAFPGTEIYKHPKDFVPLVSGTNVEVLDDEVESLKNKRIKLGKVSEEDEDGDPKDPKTREKLAKVKEELNAARERQRELE